MQHIAGAIVAFAVALTPAPLFAESGPVGCGADDLIVGPRWSAAPVQEEFDQFFPEKALEQLVSGEVVLHCKVYADGSLRPCAIASEEPQGYGFGAAALTLSQRYELPTISDGRPTVDRTVVVPLRFAYPSPSSATSQASMAYYPAAARAAGTEGEAIVSCARDAHLSLRDCVLVSEKPTGMGFGQAALAMAARSPENPKIDTKDPAITGAKRITVRFTLQPSLIEPDLTRTAHLITAPKVLAFPDGPTVGPLPLWAVSRHYWAMFALRCHIGADDHMLTGCQPIRMKMNPGVQAADGWLSEANLLIPKFRVQPMLEDGAPVADSQYVMQFDYGSPHPRSGKYTGC